MLNWFKKGLQTLRIISLGFLTVLLFVLRWLNSSVLGVLILAISIYLLVVRFGLSQPFSASELTDWFVQLSDSYKLALSSSLLTIVGFLIAFQSATSNWKNQVATSIALNAADDIQSFFAEATRKFTSAKLFADLLLKSARKVSAGGVQSEIDFEIDYVFGELQKFLALRERLSEMSIEVHDFQARYSQSLATHWGVYSKLDAATDSLSAIANTMWFTVPIVQSAELGASDRFLRAIDREQCNRFIDTYNDEFDRVTFLSGSISGSLRGSIQKYNPVFLYELLKMLPSFPELYKLGRRKK